MGDPDVESVMRRTSSRQFTRWQNYCGIEPFGDDWRRTGYTTVAIVNANGGSAEVENFMPLVREEQTLEEMIAILSVWTGVDIT